MSGKPEDKQDQAVADTGGDTNADLEKGDPLRKLTRIILYTCIALFAWYLVADRLTPWTDQARVQGFVVPITPRIAGYVTEVNVTLNQQVTRGEVLAKINPRDYELAVQNAEADLEKAGQEVGSQTATISSATARVANSKARMMRAQYNYDRTQRIFEKDPGAVSRVDQDRALTDLEQAKSKLAEAESELERAKIELGSKGEDNPKIREAVAALEQAQINLTNTTVWAPSDGAVTNLQVDVGHYAQTGSPLMTFIASDDVWVEANMRENSIGNIDKGDEVDIVLDIAPARIFKGVVESVGYGVSDQQGGSTSLGSLPTVQTESGWLREAQRFPVIIKFADDDARGLLRAGGQADVIVYTGGNFVLNTIGWVWIRLISLFSYAY